MQVEKLKEILAKIKTGELSVEQGLARLRHLPFETIEGATIDHHRSLRCGFPEVVFCGGKTEKQIVAIIRKMKQKNEPVLATRVDPAIAARLIRRFPGARHNVPARTVFVPARGIGRSTGRTRRVAATAEHGVPGSGQGLVLVISAGTSDVPVAEEACATAEAMGCRVERLFDVGIAGIHRIISQRHKLWEADVIVAVAGMEGALAGVVAGMTDRPVIAVPTSVGYGASFGGLAALLGMLNSCASGVTVVNIDNGFGAGYAAGLIARGTARQACGAGKRRKPGERPA
jgi:NCAIR mutase (PurE)-related protein